MKSKIKKAAILSYSLFIISSSFFLSSCSVSKRISRQADHLLLKDPAISQGHIGISIFDPSTGKYVYNHNADKYFIPASNTKLFSWYAGMKYLGDSLVAARITEFDKKLFIAGAGDPTTLHPSFKNQPLYDFLSKSNKTIWGVQKQFKAAPLGMGWAWDDYNASYMNERSEFPVFGNVVVFSGQKESVRYFPTAPVSFPANKIYSNNGGKGFIDEVLRDRMSNSFTLYINANEKKNVVVPFITSTALAFKILEDTLHKRIVSPEQVVPEQGLYEKVSQYVIRSQPADSLFQPMMHNSDNFFAEQTLLMASNEFLGYMSDRDMIDTILKTSLKDIPHYPKWVDGSGLSRYNLFTPQDFVWLLNKTKNEFSWERIKNTLPTGGEGTLSSYYKTEAGFIYAKTGTLSNNCALSGYLITKKNKMLIFSVLVNNYPGGATPVRRAVEKFIKQLRERY